MMATMPESQVVTLHSSFRLWKNTRIIALYLPMKRSWIACLIPWTLKVADPVWMITIQILTCPCREVSNFGRRIIPNSTRAHQTWKLPFGRPCTQKALPLVVVLRQRFLRGAREPHERWDMGIYISFSIVPTLRRRSLPTVI